MGRVPLPGRPLLHDIVPGQFDPHRLHNHNLRSGHLTDLRCSIIVQSPPSCLSFSFEQCSHIQIALEPGDMRKMPRHFPAVGDCPEPAKRSGSPCGGTMRSGSASPGEFRSRPSSRATGWHPEPPRSEEQKRAGVGAPHEPRLELINLYAVATRRAHVISTIVNGTFPRFPDLAEGPGQSPVSRSEMRRGGPPLTSGDLNDHQGVLTLHPAA
jgi:hypothetical protein